MSLGIGPCLGILSLERVEFDDKSQSRRSQMGQVTIQNRGCMI
jgi:hypothetical protein